MPDIWMDVDAAVTVPVNILPLIASADFKAVLASETYNEAGLDLIWNFVTTAGVQTHTAITPTDTGGTYDWVNVGHGMYNIELPAAVNNTEGFGWMTGVATDALPWRGPFIGFRAAGLNNLLIDDAYSATRGLSGTALPAAAADAAGGLPISDAGGLDMDAILSRIGTPANLGGGTATLAGNLADIEGQTDDIGTAGAGLTALASQASVNTIDDFLDTEIAAIKTKTDYLPSATAGAAGGVFIAGTNAATVITSSLTTTFNGNLSGSVGSVTGGVGGAVGSVTGAVGSIGAGGITSSSIGADAITAAHIANGAIDAATFAADAISAAAVSAAAAEKICDSTWAEPVPGAYGVGTAGYIVGTQGATGTGLTALPWNAAWDTEVQSEATDALNAYDPPTNAELEARTLVAASYFDPAADTVARVTLVDTTTTNTDMVAAAPSAATVADAVWDEAIAGHAGAGSTGAALAAATAPSAATVADAVWDELVAGHAGVGSTGAALAAAGGSGDPWSTALPGAYGAGTAGYVIGTQGATGTGLTALPWNAAWDAEVQSEAQDALNAYDPPTNAEMEARTLVAASYFDPAADTVARVTLVDTTTTNTDMVAAAPSAATVADAVWDEAIAGHAGAGSTGAALAAATAPSAATVADAVWDELVAGHAVVGSTGAALAAAGGSGDPWSTALPGAYLAGTAGNLLGVQVPAIKAKTDTIGAISVTITAPVATDGTSIRLICGDDYLNADGRSLSFVGTNWPVITAGSVNLIISTPAPTSIAGVITGPAACYFALTGAQTTALGVGSYGYDLQATLAGGSVITLVQGSLVVAHDVR